MSTVETTHSAYEPSTGSRIGAFASTVLAMFGARLAALVAARSARRTARLLDNLSDSQLKDIGLSRSDIWWIVRSERGQAGSSVERS
ncbi:hypothetical protein ATN84_22055 [Paramesorhizobium deserti]|uniref:YjiS-like domain-containing protein n=1 Tax=Paramesorhizobium deserti TaxID=1494590 RepID=A0A135HP41_9HYPH|nr:DUF1127 domain-containing protein [Paramesorhizobium deserti]KXF74906.1 hypothetical protein ATN84_22055 [Paramesorhizobium deserti]